MCYNPTVSLTAFILGSIFSIFLILHGNPEFKDENTVAGILLLFIAGIQFMEFLFWSDLHNKIGINRLATIIGSLFNMGQPSLIYIIKVLYFRPLIQLDTILILNFGYFAYLTYVYYRYLVNGKLTTSELVNGHLRWPWLKYINPVAFLFLFALNIFYLTDFGYSLVMFSVVYCTLLFAVVYLPKNVSELWCFMSTSVPATMLPLSYYINKIV